MKKIYNINETRGFSPSKNPPKNIKNILSKIKLFEVYPKIFAVVIKDDKLRARVFMRYQEFYESDSETFRGKGFKWSDFVKFYKEKTKRDIFSYHEDWAGYNIPCDSIESCIAKIPDLNFYDLIMFSIIDSIKSKVGGENFYLIGIDQNTGEDPSLIYHELAHGLWFSDPTYKARMSELISKMDPKIKEKIIENIGNMGYGENVHEDELQAYLSTGLIDKMKRIKNIKSETKKFSDIFDNYISGIRSNPIEIDWSTDLDL